MSTGLFITLEGGEGAGKSTLARALAHHFARYNIRVDLTREPGGTLDAEQIRNLLVSGETGRWSVMEETLLLYAARSNHVRNRILPNLRNGTWVICDRFFDSSIAYQAKIKTNGEYWSEFFQLHNIVMSGFEPHVTLILDIDPRLGLNRAHFRGETQSRFEKFSLDYHDQVRQAFLEVAQTYPHRCRVLDASRPQHEVFVDALNQIYSLYPATRSLEFQK
ncbi:MULTISPECIES: dTMP kinase [Hyphobacterium]|uniref:Thymidylate kinase n=1 Tax=Hyphobacterium vulgare TaxID=1736751 RepID=A0ABV6ZT86_9PROT